MGTEMRYPAAAMAAAMAMAMAAAAARLRQWGRFWTGRDALPLLLLLAALATVFLFANDRGHFYRPDHHDWNSAFYLSIVSNLSLEHNLQLLYYNDMLATENGLALFGVMLTFHGMVRFEQDGRFRQLPVRACAALLLGWQVYALLLPFIVFGLGRELLQAHAGIASQHPVTVRQIRGYAAALLPSRYLRLGILALLFGIEVLSFNLGNEYLAYGGKVPLLELPTAASAIYHLTAGSEPGPKSTLIRRIRTTF